MGWEHIFFSPDWLIRSFVDHEFETSHSTNELDCLTLALALWTRIYFPSACPTPIRHGTAVSRGVVQPIRDIVAVKRVQRKIVTGAGG